MLECRNHQCGREACEGLSSMLSRHKTEDNVFVRVRGGPVSVLQDKIYAAFYELATPEPDYNRSCSTCPSASFAVK